MPGGIAWSCTAGPNGHAMRSRSSSIANCIWNPTGARSAATRRASPGSSPGQGGALQRETEPALHLAAERDVADGQPVAGNERPVVAGEPGLQPGDRKSVVEGTSVAVRVDLGGRRIIKKKQK